MGQSLLVITITQICDSYHGLSSALPTNCTVIAQTLWGTTPYEVWPISGTEFAMPLRGETDVRSRGGRHDARLPISAADRDSFR